MRVEDGTVVGPLAVDDHLLLSGTVTGDVTVARGGELELTGTVAGSLHVLAGGSTELDGTVAGDVVSAGRVVVRGVVLGRLDEQPGATTTIERFARIDGRIY